MSTSPTSPPTVIVAAKETWVAYLLWFFFGLLGVHKFYLGKIGWGILYLLTGGIFLIGWLIDLFTIPSQVRQYNDGLLAGIARS
jgi:TM2 domain-containing membrane protein YozV